MPTASGRIQQVYVGGMPFGVKFFTDGVMVVGLAESTEGGPSPAAQAGLAEGDRILAINGQDMKGLDENDTPYVTNAISAYREGSPALQMEVERNGERVFLELTPQMNAQEGRFMVGINMLLEYTPAYRPVSLFEAIGLGADYCVRSGTAILKALGQMLRTGEGLKESSGPIGIVQLIAEKTKENGWATYGELLVLISVNLGLFNLFPIPALDGGRVVGLLLTSAVEAVTKKKIDPKYEGYIHGAGMVLLLAFMAVVMFKDIFVIFKR